MKLARFAVVAVLMAGTAATVYLRSDLDDVPESVPLELLPQTVDQRQATDIPIDAETLANIRLHHADAVDLLDWLPAGAIGRVDLLYPDPWPKRRHWKRRSARTTSAGSMRTGFQGTTPRRASVIYWNRSLDCRDARRSAI